MLRIEKSVCKTLPNGEERWELPDGKLHRDLGPARITPEGDQYYYQNGKMHRDGEPAVIFQDGHLEYWQLGLRHREDGPANIPPEDNKEFRYGYYLRGYMIEPEQFELELARMKKRERR